MTFIKSKYNGTCKKCKQPILAGMEIAWFGKGAGAEHRHCPGAPWAVAEAEQGVEHFESESAKHALRGRIGSFSQEHMVFGANLVQLSDGVWESKFQKGYRFAKGWTLEHAVTVRTYFPERVCTVRMAWEYDEPGVIMSLWNLFDRCPARIDKKSRWYRWSDGG